MKPPVSQFLLVVLDDIVYAFGADSLEIAKDMKKTFDSVQSFILKWDYVLQFYIIVKE